MRLTLDLPDDLAAVYQEYCRANQPLEELLVVQLHKFRLASPKDRFLLLPPAARARLEEIIGIPLTTADVLVRRVDALGVIRLGNIRLNFTMPQLREIKRRADLFGRTAEEYTAELVRVICERMLDLPAEAGLPPALRAEKGV